MARPDLVAKLVDYIRHDTVVKDEDLSDIIGEAERTGDCKALFREYSRRRAAVKAPDFSGMTEPERAAEAERLRREALGKARRLRAEGDHLAAVARREEVLASILDFDPKQRGEYYNRLYYVHHETFDLDEECPKRGLVLLNDNYVETDLKIKDHQGQDRELSKGILEIRGIAGRSLATSMVESESLATRLSTVDVMYSFLKRAVEATIAIEVVRGDFYGEIKAHSTSISNSLVLHDSKLAGVMNGFGKGVIQLMRPVVSVPLKDMLFIVIRTGDGISERMIEFTPRVSGGDEDEIVVGVIKMRVKVAWSIVYS